MHYHLKAIYTDGTVHESPLTWEEIEDFSQGDDEMLAVRVGQLKVGETDRTGGGAQPIFDITALAD